MTARGLASLTWPAAVGVLGMFGFAAFVLWLTATTFDASEVKSLLMLSAGYVVREFLPMVTAALHGTAAGLQKGGQGE